MNWHRVVASVAVACLFAIPAWADVAPPRAEQAERIQVPVTIRRGAIRGADRNVQAKIIIPRYLVQTEVAREVPRGAAPAKEPAKEEMGAAPTNYGVWIAGIALSLAAASLVFVIRGQRTTRAAGLATLVGAIVLGGWSAANADLAPVRPAGPQILIELVDDADTVTLQLVR